MQIGLSSIVGDGFGSGSFQVSEVAGTPPSNPPYGTVLSTLYGTDYEWGSFFSFNFATYYVQTCDVNVVADGSGGSFVNWAGASNVAYKPYGTVFYTDTNSGVNNVTVLGDDYPCSSWDSIDYVHDGGGYWTSIYINFIQVGYGTFIVNDGTSGSATIQMPDTNYYAYQTWDSTDYYHDGSCGYYTSGVNYWEAEYEDFIYNDGTAGSNTTTLPDAINYTWRSWTSIDYYWTDNSGNYYAVKNDLYSAAYGDFITNIDGTNYYWDGSGGYYTE